MNTKPLLLLTLALLCSMLSYGQGATCAEAAPFCTGTAEIFPNTADGATAEFGPDYDCLFSQPNPAWYFMQVGVAGDINLTIAQESGGGTGLDVDFICWGPFASLDGVCNQLTLGNVVDCSYSTSAVEACNIPNTQVGEFYMVLITNFSNQAGTIDFQQTGGDGETDCNVLEPCFADAGPDHSYCEDQAPNTIPLGGMPSASGGSSVFTYSWSPTTGLDDPTSPNPILTPEVGITTYTLTVDDGAGCVVSDDVTIEIIAMPQPSCGPNQSFDCNTAELVIDASGSGFGTYNWFTLDGNIIEGEGFPVITVDSPGTYELEFTSLEGCTGFDFAVISEPTDPVVNVSLSATDPYLCEGESTDMTIDFSQVGNYIVTYMIDGVAQSPLEVLSADQVIFNTDQAGVYNVINVENPYCTPEIEGIVNIEVEPLPLITLPTEEVFLCPAEVEGVDFLLEGTGDLTFTYSIDGNPQPAVVEQAGIVTIPISESGLYEAVVISSDECVGFELFGGFEAIDVPNPTANFLNAPVICAGEVAELEVALTGNAPYTINYLVNGILQDITFSEDDDVSLFTSDAGMVEILALSDLHCEGIPHDTTTVTVNPLPIANISGGDIFCSNEEVELNIDMTGTGPFTVQYAVNGTAAEAVISDSSPYAFSTMLSGTYEVLSIADQVCDDGVQNSTIISHYAPITASLDYTEEICENDSLTVTATASGGHPNGYAFTWADNNENTYSGNPLSLEVTEDIQLFLTVNDECNLPNSGQAAIVDVQAYPEPAYIAFEDSICVGETAAFERTAVDESISCSWSFDDGTVINGCQVIDHTFLLSGYQGLVLSSSTSAGCTTATPFDSVIYVIADPVAEFSFVPAEGTIFEPEVIFLNESEGALEYHWDYSDGEGSAEFEETHFFPPAVAGFYPVCLTAYNALGCTDTICNLVEIKPEFLMSAPNAFTPDQDGLNDFFIPVFNDIVLADYNLQIYNRFGEIIFETDDQFQHWDGRGAQSSDYYSVDGVYFYKVRTREINRTETREFVGEINILR